MEQLASLGIFFGGLGILLISFGIFYYVSVYEKINKPKDKKKK